MESALSKMIIAVSLLPVILIAGIILRIKSRPYNNLTFSVHKIIAVIYTVFVIIIFVNYFRELFTGGMLPVLVLSGVLFLVISFVTGALQSFEKPAPSFVVALHKISSYLMLVIIPASFILIYNL